MDQKTIINIFIILPLLGYLLGAIPFGLLVGKLKGIDIRTQGSGNIGTTNVARILGKKWGYICFILDVGKGLIPVLYTGSYLKRLFEIPAGESVPLVGQLAWLAVAAMCILGHMFSIYLRFRGGKGVATSLGVILGIWPYFTLTGIIVFLIWAAVWGFSRYVSLASMVAALGFPLFFGVLIYQIPAWRIDALWPLFVFSCIMGALVIIRHKSNIKRLLSGTENRGGRNHTPPGEPITLDDHVENPDTNNIPENRHDSTT